MDVLCLYLSHRLQAQAVKNHLRMVLLMRCCIKFHSSIDVLVHIDLRLVLIMVMLIMCVLMCYFLTQTASSSNDKSNESVIADKVCIQFQCVAFLLHCISQQW